MGAYSAQMANHPFDWKPAFLAALRNMPVIRHACDAVGINRSTAWRAREADELFAKEWDEAMADGVDAAEAAAFKRGVEGFDEPVVFQGRLSMVPVLNPDGTMAVHEESGEPIMRPLTVRKHSDALLALVLKGRRKEVYADRTELAGVDGQPLQVADPTARAARVAQLIELAKQRKDHSDLA